MALKLKKSHENVTVVDLDIVNPYFRTADFKELLHNNSIRLIAPVYANTNLDIPALPPDINSIFDDKSTFCVIDVGGDDAGAIALGQYAARLNNVDFDLYYVINQRRYLTNDAESAVELLREIEMVARVKATKLINNTNLGTMTTADTVKSSFEFADSVSKLTGLPIAFTCLRQDLAAGGDEFFPVEIYVKTGLDG